MFVGLPVDCRAPTPTPRPTPFSKKNRHELYFWHNAGPWGSLATHVQPTQHYEQAETKRRMHNLLQVS